VITIILILAAMLVPALHTARAKALYARWRAHSAGTRSSDMLELYYDFEEDNNYSTKLTNKAVGAGLEFYEPKTGNASASGGLSVQDLHGRWIGKGGIYLRGSGTQFNANEFRWAPLSKSDNRPVTVMFWVHTLSAEKGSSTTFRLDGEKSPDRMRFQCHTPWSNNRIYWDYGSCCSAGRVDTSFANYLDDWTQVTFVSAGRNGNFRAIYLNGKLAAKKTSTQLLGGPRGIRQGFRFGGDRYKGRIDELAMWRRVMPQDEILAHFQNGQP